VAINRVRANEASSKTVTFTIQNQDGTAVPLAELVAATLTLYDLETYVPNGSPVVGIINSRDDQDVLNANDVTIHATSGLLTWVMAPEDNVIVTAKRQMERHRAEFHLVSVGGSFDFEFEIEVVNLRKAA